MILYVNGDSHTAAAEAVNGCAFAEDDASPLISRLGRKPHPDNDRVSWAWRLSNLLGSAYVNQSESASSNDRILRTTHDWLAANRHLWNELLVIIQWSTWERAEWLIDGAWYQINASGLDHVPASHQSRYQQWVTEVDWPACTRIWHHKIWCFHGQLQQWGVKHVFFNGNTHFDLAENHENWQASYLDPYSDLGTYNTILRQQGYQTVNPDSWHFGADAHCFWAQYMLQYCISNNLVETDALSLD